ncbi:MAG TPA: glycosyl hydrolase 53 family protein, partial [Phycisphaerae bacterium]|nr:glycosyl hydrolase 53 family protein [Phycisphaerae bacterium]
MRIQIWFGGAVFLGAGIVYAAAQTAPDPQAASQTSTAQAAPARGGRGGRGGRGAVPGQQFPSQIQDTVTSQWYTPQRHADYAFGVDISSLRQTEQQGRIQYKDNGTTKPALQIFHDHGFNWVRIRVVTEPARLPQNVAYVTALAKDAKKLGYKFLLDFHYSDGWSDPRPNSHPIPSAWRNLNHQDLVKALFEYSRDTIAAFAKEDVLPDMIQIGNEVSNGFMAP